MSNAASSSPRNTRQRSGSYCDAVISALEAHGMRTPRSNVGTPRSLCGTPRAVTPRSRGNSPRSAPGSPVINSPFSRSPNPRTRFATSGRNEDLRRSLSRMVEIPSPTESKIPPVVPPLDLSSSATSSHSSSSTTPYRSVVSELSSSAEVPSSLKSTPPRRKHRVKVRRHTSLYREEFTPTLKFFLEWNPFDPDGKLTPLAKKVSKIRIINESPDLSVIPMDKLEVFQRNLNALKNLKELDCSRITLPMFLNAFCIPKNVKKCSFGKTTGHIVFEEKSKCEELWIGTVEASAIIVTPHSLRVLKIQTLLSTQLQFPHESLCQSLFIKSIFPSDDNSACQCFVIPPSITNFCTEKLTTQLTFEKPTQPVSVSIRTLCADVHFPHNVSSVAIGHSHSNVSFADNSFLQSFYFVSRDPNTKIRIPQGIKARVSSFESLFPLPDPWSLL